MKIDTASSLFYAPLQRQGTPSGDRMAASAGASATAGGAGIQSLDFSGMSRQELRDWTNARIRSGDMSLDESRPFMAMGMAVPVEGPWGAHLQAAGDQSPQDFTRLVEEGLAAARQRGDGKTLEMLESARATMQRMQGTAIGVDLHA
jgi:hypothetical protein